MLLQAFLHSKAVTLGLLVLPELPCRRRLPAALTPMQLWVVIPKVYKSDIRALTADSGASGGRQGPSLCCSPTSCCRICIVAAAVFSAMSVAAATLLHHVLMQHALLQHFVLLHRLAGKFLLLRQLSQLNAADCSAPPHRDWPRFRQWLCFSDLIVAI